MIQQIMVVALYLVEKHNSGGSVTTFGSLHCKKSNTTENDYGGILTFNTREHGNSNFERMRIDSFGRVFINSVGATTPTTDYRSLNLVAHAHTEAGVSFSRSSSTMGGGSTAGKSIIMHSDGALYVSTHNVGRDLTITSGQKVGIATETPATTLDVQGDVAVAYNATHALRFYTQPKITGHL